MGMGMHILVGIHGRDRLFGKCRCRCDDNIKIGFQVAWNKFN
jgi:hypothetical protein